MRDDNSRSMYLDQNLDLYEEQGMKYHRYRTYQQTERHIDSSD